MATIDKMLLLSLTIAANTYSQAGSEKDYHHDRANSQITFITPEGNAILHFKDKDAGNSKYFLGTFGENPAIVHLNNSLNSYFTYAVLEYNKPSFFIDCIYAETKSNQNGICAKEGQCGLNIRIGRNDDLTAERLDEVASNIHDCNNAIQTLYFLNGKIKHLPIMLLRSPEQYVFKTFKTSQDLINGKYKIFSCITATGRCERYDDYTWVIVTNKSPLKVEFKKIYQSHNRNLLGAAKPEKTYNIKELPIFPHKVSAERAFFYDESFNQKKSYLINGDKITLLSIDDEDKWCKIRYINEKNKNFLEHMQCSDLSI